MDIIDPSYDQQEITRKSRKREKYQERLRVSRTRRAAWLLSGLTIEKFCEVRAIPVKVLLTDNQRVCHVAEHPGSALFDPKEWILSDNSNPWSFIWCLTQLFGNPEQKAAKIRAHVFFRTNPIASERTA
jgi:hypothetical protein